MTIRGEGFKWSQLRQHVVLGKKHGKHKFGIVLDGTLLELTVAVIPNYSNMRLNFMDADGATTLCLFGRVLDNEFIVSKRFGTLRMSGSDRKS